MVPGLKDDSEWLTTSGEGVTAEEVETEDQNQKWGLKVGLDGCNLRMELEHVRSCFSWRSKGSGFLRRNLLAKMLRGSLKGQQRIWNIPKLS